MRHALIQTLSKSVNGYLLPVLQVMFGSLLLALTAQIAIPLPFTPVPVTLQTLGVSLLAITLGPKKAVLAVILYLIEATMGMPVLAAGSVNPLWMIGPHAGYLIGFIFAASITGSIFEKYRCHSFEKSCFLLLLNEIVILSAGTFWLGSFVGWENAIAMGMIPFIPGALCKTLLASVSVQAYRK